MATDFFAQRPAVTPTIYVYNLPQVTTHKGYVKVGYTDRDVETRINEQMHTSGLTATILYAESAMCSDGSIFTDKDVHRVLRRKGFRQMNEGNDRNEWFNCSVNDVKAAIVELKTGIITDASRTATFKMRPEQHNAVKRTMEYFAYAAKEDPGRAPKFLWNAKLVPETSCEAYNEFLDRGMIIGTCKNRNIGFFSNWSEQSLPEHQGSTHAQSDRTNQAEQTTRRIDAIVNDIGTSLADTAYDRIWKSLLEWSDTEEEKNNLQLLIDCSSRMVGKEKPYQNMEFSCTAEGDPYYADLYWPNAGVIVMAAESEEAYEVAKKTSWKCFYLGDPEFDCEALISAIKEG